MKQKHFFRARGGLYFTMLGLTLALFAILIFALTLPFNSVNTNAVLRDSILPDVLLILIDLVEILAYAAGASLLIFAAFRPFSASTVICLASIYAATTVLRYGMDLIGAWILYGTRYFLYNILEPTLLNQLPFLFLDLAFVVIALVLSLTFADHYYRKKAVLTKASVLFQSDAASRPVLEDLYPFSKPLSLKNPLQRCAFILGCLLTAANGVSNILFDIRFLSMATSVGFLDILSMFGSYAYSLLIGVIFYTVCMLLFHVFFRYQNRLTK